MATFLKQNKVKRRQYDAANLHRAFEATRTGVSVYRAARQYSIPESTLRDKTRGNQPLIAICGPDRLFSEEEERQMVAHIKYMGKIGYGYSKVNVQYLGTDFAASCHKKDSDKPMSDSWFYCFMKRHPDLKVAKPQKLSMIRAKSASQDVIDTYFKELAYILTTNKLHDKPERIYNIDETGVNAEHVPTRVVCDSNSVPQAITSPRSSTITIIGAGNAIGNHIPPYYVFPGKRWNDLFLEGAAPGSTGQMSDNGWSNSAIFHEYLTGHFAKHAGIVENSPPTLLLYDGHRSHVSLTLVDWAKKRNVVLFVLPPHTSHITQPLDVGIFGPFKTMYHRECQLYLQKNPGIHITKYEIASLTNKPYVKAMSSENLSAAFKKVGVHPFQKTITSDQLAPSVIYIDTSVDPDMSVNPDTPDDVDMPAERNTPTDAHMHTDHEPNNTQPLPNTDHCVNTTTNSVSCVSMSVSKDFFASRAITKVINKPRRKFVPPFIGGSLLKQKNVKILQLSATKAANKSLCETAPARKPSAAKKSTVKQHPTSKPPQSPKPGPSTYHVDTHEDSQSLSEEDESEKCCVCGMFEPREIRESIGEIYFKWAACDRCPHWTHLRFCSDTTVVRRHGEFLCPHCQL